VRGPAAGRRRAGLLQDAPRPRLMSGSVAPTFAQACAGVSDRSARGAREVRRGGRYRQRKLGAEPGESSPTGTLVPGGSTRQGHFNVTALLADPPELLFTVMVCGFVGQENWPVYLPPPLFVSAPINWF